MKTSGTLARWLQAFFACRLLRERAASPHTVASYRDCFRLLLAFAQGRLKKPPAALALEDLDAPLVGAFLDHLEKDRGNSARSRNTRLAAVHSFFRYVALHEPACAALAQRVLALPPKRHGRRPVTFLDRPEIEALLAAPDRKTRGGRRDRALLLLAVQTGLRVSEITGLACRDVFLGPGPHVRCCGKGRKERSTPLRRDAAAALRGWAKERGGKPDDTFFPNARGAPLSRDGVGYILDKHAEVARRRCPSLHGKRVTPHVLRHSAAMDLLHHGVDRSVIALWLGHESPETTQMYLHASLELKERALARTRPLRGRTGRYRPKDTLLAFLEAL